MARFWVGGTGTWDATDTTHWATATNGAGGASVPVAADTVTFDASSGGGTVTVNTDVTVTSITMGAFTGTLDFSVNNNNVNLSATTAFSGTGTGVRTLKMGNGTWSMTGPGSNWDMTTTTNLTFNAGGSTLQWSNVTPSATRSFITGGLTYANFNVVSPSPANGRIIQLTGSATFTGTFTVNGGANILPTNATTTTINNLVISGSASAPAALMSSSTTGTATFAVTTATIDFAALRWMTFTGGPSRDQLVRPWQQ
jgi:hypothetical protein